MKQKIALVFGGKSPEHEVSLDSATTIYHAVKESEFEIILLGNNKNGDWCYDADYLKDSIDLQVRDYFLKSRKVYLQRAEEGGLIMDSETHQILERFTLVFPIIHGAYGEDGTLQGYLRFLGIPFIGSDVLGSSICMDKEITKRVLRDHGIPIAKFITLSHINRNRMSFGDVVKILGNPIFCKPCNAGSSIGVSKVSHEDDFQAALALAFQYDKKVLLEEAVIGKEIECGIIGNENPLASALGEITPISDFYSYEVKYFTTSNAIMKIPAEIPKYISERIRRCATQAYQATCCEGFARVDFFLKADGRFVVNEINTLPGFTAHSMYPKLFEYSGLSLTHLITEILALALKKYKLK